MEKQSNRVYQARRARRTGRHEIRAVDYCCNEWGDENSPLLLFLHGWGDCGATFQFVVDELQQDWHVVAPDWRGHGRSGHMGTSYWFPDYLADLHAILDIYSPDDSVNLVGHSMGANIGGLYAGIFPSRVRRFINIEGFGLADGDPQRAPDNYRRWIESGLAATDYRSYQSFDELMPRIQKRSPRMSAEQAMFVAQQWARHESGDVVRIRADAAHKMPNAVQYRRAEAEACWNKVEADVLLVLGAETDFTSDLISWLDPDMSNHPFRNAPTVSIPDVGHMVHFEAPGALAVVIEEFLAKKED
jgi:pimeloyl-ACP methyl ester carboxylesterase